MLPYLLPADVEDAGPAGEELHAFVDRAALHAAHRAEWRVSGSRVGP